MEREILALKRQHRYQEAWQALAALRRAGQDTPELRVEEADCLARLDRPEQALALLRATRPLPLFGRALLAGLLEYSGDPTSAVRFEELAAEPRLPLAVARRVSRHFQESGQPERALELARRHADDSPEGVRYLAHALEAADHHAESLTVLQQACPAHPELVEDWLVRSLEGQDPERSAQALEHLLSQPDHAESLALRERLAQALRKSKHSTRALEVMLDCARRNPGDAYLLANLGYLYHELGQHERALDYFELALERAPRDRYTLNAYLATCRDAGQRKRAVAYVARRVRAHPLDRKLWGMLRRIFGPARAASPAGRVSLRLKRGVRAPRDHVGTPGAPAT